MSFSLFKDLTLHLIYILIPSLSYLLLLVFPFLYPVPSHSCDPLEDLLPSLSQYGSTSTLPDDEDIDFWWSYLRIHFHYWWFPLLQLSIITYWLTICWIRSMFKFNNIYSHGLDVLVLWDCLWRPYFPIYGISCARLCCTYFHSFQIFEDSSLLYIVDSIHLCNIRGLVPVPYYVLKYCKGVTVPIYST